MPPKIPRKCLKPPKFQLPRFKLLGASDCNNPSAIPKKQILAWEKQGIIEYLGETKDVRPFVESASCVVLPSSYKEGVPRVLLEAMSMGKAIIATNIAGCKECVAPPFTAYKNLLIGQNGILIPPKDAHALSLAMTLLASNTLPNTAPNTLTQMGANARAFVKARFCISRVIAHYTRAVTSILESSFTKRDSALLKKHRLMPNASLVLGSHSADFGDCHTWQSKAYNESKKVDSRNALFTNAKSMDRHADFQSARNDNKNAVFQKVDSRENAQSLNESHAEAKLDSMDCHATASAVSRNDYKNTICKKVDSSDEAPNLHQQAQDSRIFTQNAKNLSKPHAEAKADSSKSPRDSKILELESWLLLKKPASASPCTASLVFEPRAEIRLGGLSHKRGDEIHDSSPKAESLTNLVFVSNTCFGMYNFRLQVLQSLQKSGFAIHIIAPFDASTSSLNQEGFTTHNIRLDSRSLNPLKDFRTTYTLYKLLRRIRPALVFNYTIKPAIYSSSVCNALKIPNIAIITGLGYVFINDKGEKSSLKKRVLRFIVCLMYRFALKATQEVWFLNNDDKQEFLSHKLIAQDQAFLLDSEGVDTEYFSPKVCKDPALQTQETQGEIVFLLVARMLWDKGVGEFVEAAKMVQESMQKANKIESNGGGA
ncbi:glycosyltransferase [Helicobacter canis]|uniref:Glycosyltransferase n=1 Tax=Helicobacter canis TaxID=29419 RepID=A0A377J6Q1_9HELI|nr:glycosyltransferase [Helicobacter canis]STO97506.1 glycosyltransferase [Helicobacter canis]